MIWCTSRVPPKRTTAFRGTSRLHTYFRILLQTLALNLLPFNLYSAILTNNIIDRVPSNFHLSALNLGSKSLTLGQKVLAINVAKNTGHENAKNPDRDAGLPSVFVCANSLAG